MNLWQRESRLRQILRVAGDGAATIAACWAAFWLRINLPLPFTVGLLPGDRLGLLERDWGVVLVLQFPSLYFFGFYGRPRPRSRTEALRLLAGAIALQGAALTGYFFFSF